MIKKHTFCINGYSDDIGHIILQVVVSKIALIKDWKRAVDPIFIWDILLRNVGYEWKVCHWTKPRDK